MQTNGNISVHGGISNSCGNCVVSEAVMRGWGALGNGVRLQQEVPPGRWDKLAGWEIPIGLLLGLCCIVWWLVLSGIVWRVRLGVRWSNRWDRLGQKSWRIRVRYCKGQVLVGALLLYGITCEGYTGLVRCRNNASYTVFFAGPNGAGVLVGASGESCFYAASGGCADTEGAGCALTVRSNGISGVVLGTVGGTVNLTGTGAGAPHCGGGSCSGAVCTTNYSVAVWNGAAPVQRELWCTFVAFYNPRSTNVYMVAKCKDGSALQCMGGCTDPIGPGELVSREYCKEGGPCDIVVSTFAYNSGTDSVDELASGELPVAVQPWRSGSSGGTGGSGSPSGGVPVVVAPTNNTSSGYITNTGGSIQFYTNVVAGSASDGTLQQGFQILHTDGRNLLITNAAIAAASGVTTNLLMGVTNLLGGVTNLLGQAVSRLGQVSTNTASGGGTNIDYRPNFGTVSNELRNVLGAITNGLTSLGNWTNLDVGTGFVSRLVGSTGLVSQFEGFGQGLTNRGRIVWGESGTNVTDWTNGFVNMDVGASASQEIDLSLTLFSGTPQEIEFDLNPMHHSIWSSVIPWFLELAKWFASVWFLYGCWKFYESKAEQLPLVAQVRGAAQSVAGFNASIPSGLVFAGIMTSTIIAFLASWGAIWLTVSTVIQSGPYQAMAPEMFRKGLILTRMLMPIDFIAGLFVAYWIFRTSLLALYHLSATLIRFLVSCIVLYGITCGAAQVQIVNQSSLGMTLQWPDNENSFLVEANEKVEAILPEGAGITVLDYPEAANDTGFTATEGLRVFIFNTSSNAIGWIVVSEVVPNVSGASLTFAAAWPWYVGGLGVGWVMLGFGWVMRMVGAAVTERNPEP